MVSPLEGLRHTYGYSSLRSPKHSDFLKTDHITRTVNACEKIEVVPRIPQPYKTSFSAVISPYKSEKAINNERNYFDHLRGERLYSSMPLNKLLNSKRSLSTSPCAISHHKGCNKHVRTLSSSPQPEKSQSIGQLTSNHCTDKHDVDLHNVRFSKSADILSCDVIEKEEVIMPSTGCNGSVRFSDKNDYHVFDNVKIKQFIEKEYVHVHKVCEYNSILKKLPSSSDNDSKKSQDSLNHNDRSPLQEVSDYSPRNANEIASDDCSRPSSKNNSKHPTSLKKSISNFFKKLSPSPKLKKRYKSNQNYMNSESDSSLSNSCNNSSDYSVSNFISKSVSLKSMSSRLKKTHKTKETETENNAHDSSVVKSISSDITCESYESLKTSKSSDNDGINGEKDSLNFDNDIFLKSPQSTSVDNILNPSFGIKNASTNYKYPRVLVDSIGHCSIGANLAGSEPCLSSRNRSRSGLKHTVHINNSSSQYASTNSPSIPFDRSVSSNDDPSSFDKPAKMPSYVKLSCAVNGYSSYNKYINGSSRNTVARTVDLYEGNQSKEIPKDDSENVGLLNNCVNNVEHISNEAVEVKTNKVGDEESNLCSIDSNISDSVLSESLCDSNHVSDRNSLRQSLDCSEFTLNLDNVNSAKLKENVIENATSPDTPAKNGTYFHGVVNRTEAMLKERITVAEEDLEKPIPEEASGIIRAAIGSTNLINTKKFRQFRALCDKNMSQKDDEPFPTTNQDLAGFWDLILIQVEEMNTRFDNINKLKSNGWIALNSPKRTTPHKSKALRAKTSQTQKSEKAVEAARLRSEARKLLLEAKKAGRQRVASLSEEVEIVIM